MDLRWSGLSLETTKTHRRCKNWFPWSQMRLQIKLKPIFRLENCLVLQKKLKLNWQLLGSWYYKEKPSWNHGILNSRRLKRQWMMNNSNDGNFNLLLLFKDASIWLEFWAIYFKLRKIWRNSWFSLVLISSLWLEILKELINLLFKSKIL